MKPRKACRARRGERGSSLLEGALCFFAFIVMVLGSMDFGWLVYAYNECSYAARDGARYASVRGSGSGRAATTSTVSSYVKGNVAGLIPANVTVTTAWSPDEAPGSTVSVTVSSVQYPMGPLSYYIGSSFTVASTAKRTISQ